MDSIDADFIVSTELCFMLEEMRNQSVLSRCRTNVRVCGALVGVWSAAKHGSVGLVGLS